ncbi:MAG TPA: hypothetical protein VE781_02790, partial [Kineosporiaceae bacterium]|nr:hypothetical protein [Kineosporiaceae bacterium]
MSTDVVTLVKDFIVKLVSDHGTAEQFAQDPHGTLAAQGITEHDLSGVDVHQLVGQACQSPEVPDHARSALQDYAAHSSAHGGHQSVEHVVQELTQVTQITYKDDHSITETINDHHVDNSTDITAGDDIGGGSGITTIDTGHNATATGDHAQAIDGDNYGQANTGDGAVQVGGPNSGVVNTGVNAGVQAGHDVGQGVVGDHNTTASVGSADHGALNFGSGSATTSDISHSSLGDGAT